MNRCVAGLSDDEYRSLWMKCRQLVSLEEEEKDLEDRLERGKTVFAANAIHREFRSPWVIEGRKKKVLLEKIFATTLTSDEPEIVDIDEGQLFNFVQEVYRNRVSKICELAIDKAIRKKNGSVVVNSCEVDIANFAATFAIPPIFGHFLGKENMMDFIEAVGGTFDNFANDQDAFLASFDESFLSLVLREFFFSSVLRPYVGEQFTAFFDFFSCVKRAEGVQYTRIQRFFSLFLSELTNSIRGCPFLRVFFARITREFQDKSRVIMTVILSSIVSYIMAYPRAYGVVPLTANYSEDILESVSVVKYYCTVCSGLQLSAKYASMTPVQEWEKIDTGLINRLVEELLKPGVILDGPEVESVFIPMQALLFLAKFSSLIVPEAERKRFMSLEGAILRVPVIKTQQPPACSALWDSDVKLMLELMTSHHLEMASPVIPRIKAIQAYFSVHPPNIAKVTRVIDESCELLSKSVIQLQARVSGINRVIDCAKKAVVAADTSFVNAIAQSIYTKHGVVSEIEKKKNAIWKDGNIFATFVCNTVDKFYQKNQWAGPFIPMIARRFHSVLMNHFKLTDFCDKEHQLFLDDQKFLSLKPKILKNLEQNGLDECVQKITSAKTILDIAQMAVMRACLFENPIESARQIVLSLFVVEDLFVFEFGVQPEANQLMPLLANLFIETPIPTPLCFGRWMSHFLQSAIRLKPDWFLDNEFRSLEHYFQFNAWVADMLQSM